MEQRSQLTVLVVEDDADLSTLMLECVQGMGFRTILASTRREAHSLIGEADILLTDLMMPNGENDVLLDEWVQRKGLDSSIVVSGYLNNKLKGSLYVKGVTYVYDKPIKLHVLLALLRRVERFARQAFINQYLTTEVKRLRALVEAK